MINLNREKRNACSGSVLVVDDARLMRHLLGHFIESIGLTVIHAENGHVAWQLLLQRPPDVIITDIEMPILDGLQLVKQIRNSADKRIRPLPIFICSSLSDRSYVNVHEHVDRVLSKPIDLNQLRLSLEAYC